MHLIILGLVLVLAAFLRFWAAPLSTGPDVGQFWAFAKVFQQHGLDFYQYADGNLDIFPTQGWGFVYPPVWLLILGIVLRFVPAASATEMTVDVGWRLAMKTPIIMADLAIGILLYWAVPGPKWRKLIFAGLWLFHPAAWFESGVFGQFDAIAAGFLLAAVILLVKGKDRLAFLLGGLAVMTKQHTLIPFAVMAVIAAGQMDKRRWLTDCMIAVGVVLVLSIPFLLTGNLLMYGRSLFVPGSAPGYQSPLVFSFSGSGALLTFLHDVFGWDTGGLILFTVPVLIIALIITAVFSYRKSISPLPGALAGFLVFVGLFYRINYQYLIVYIPLAILLASRTEYRSEKIITLVLAMLPAAWIWLTNIPWWFTDKQPHYEEAIALLSRIGLAHDYLPDYVYVSFAVVLMCLAIACTVLIFVKRRAKPAVR